MHAPSVFTSASSFMNLPGNVPVQLLKPTYFSIHCRFPWTVFFFLHVFFFLNVTSAASFFFCFFPCAKGNQYGTEGDKSTHCRERPSRSPHLWSHGTPGHRGGAGKVMEGCRDVKFDLWKDEMVGDQRAGAG